MKLRVEAERRISVEKERRQSEIYQSLKEAREQTNKEAEKEEQEEERFWAEQGWIPAICWFSIFRFSKIA